jgi:hypothetical protein
LGQDRIHRFLQHRKTIIGRDNYRNLGLWHLRLEYWNNGIMGEKNISPDKNFFSFTHHFTIPLFHPSIGYQAARRVIFLNRLILFLKISAIFQFLC